MAASVLILGSVAVVALLLTHARAISTDECKRGAAAHSLVLALLVQAAHFIEEAATGLYRALPGLFGQAAMPVTLFVVFNLGWLAIWVASVPGVRTGRLAAFFAAWFLAVAGVVNGIGHPLVALATWSFFPGLVTAPVAGVACAVLGMRLTQATHDHAGRPRVDLER